MTDHRGRLVADLAPGEGTSNHRHRLQLLADTNAVEGRWNRHPAGLADPGGSRDVAAAEVLTRLLGGSSLGSELPLQGVDDLTQALGVYALLASLKLAHRGLQFREGIELVWHKRIIPNICLELNILTREIDLKKKDWPHPALAPTSPKPGR